MHRGSPIRQSGLGHRVERSQGASPAISDPLVRTTLAALDSEVSPRIRRRIEMVLLRQRGWNSAETARHIRCNPGTVSSWYRVFLMEGLRGLAVESFRAREKSPSAIRRDSEISAFILESEIAGKTVSSRAIAQRYGVSHTTALSIRRKIRSSSAPVVELSPGHRWPQGKQRVDLLGVYFDPGARLIVIQEYITGQRQPGVRSAPNRIEVTGPGSPPPKDEFSTQIPELIPLLAILWCSVPSVRSRAKSTKEALRFLTRLGPRLSAESTGHVVYSVAHSSSRRIRKWIEGERRLLPHPAAAPQSWYSEAIACARRLGGVRLDPRSFQNGRLMFASFSDILVDVAGPLRRVYATPSRVVVERGRTWTPHSREVHRQQPVTRPQPHKRESSRISSSGPER